MAIIRMMACAITAGSSKRNISNIGHLQTHFGNKEVKIGKPIYPTGDVKADMNKYKSFYTGVKGKYPERQYQVSV